MKKFIYTLIFAAVAFACTPADPLEGVVVDNTVSAESTIDIFSRDGGEDFITLTLKSEAREWSLHQLSGEDWCTPSVLSGKASSTIKVVVDANKEGAPREALLVFTATGCPNDTLRINQEGLIEEPVPAGMTYGINLNKEENSATLVLYELDKNEERHDYCYLLGDFNGWEPSAAYAMKRDEQRGCWWITLTDLDPAKEYMFQYYVGYVNKVGETPVRISDPFSRIIYSESDSSIEPQTYPNLPNYPSETSGLVSAFQLEEEEYDWIHTWETNPGEGGKFKIEDKHDLIIYELLVRDFTETRNLQGVIDKMSYLKNLGINAIELMPVQEFDNHHSWGYDPNSYFALDKDYGTREMYKKFIDECHKNGIAVLFDVVYNHLTGASSLAKLYFQRSYTSAWNPWFNKYAPHPYSVYHDLNHDDPFLNNLVKENLKFLLEEYKIDGFRFDLTKGFTNVNCDEGSASWHKEDRERFLKGYYDAIHAANPYAVMICEHFCDAEEERLLAEHGIQLWRHSNNAYCQAAMGYSSDSDFSNMHTDGTGMPFGSLVSFMESHDEERISFKAKEYAPENVKEDLGARMRRSGICAAFSLMVPGPKMIWQFGELGYDFSINQNEEGKFHDSDAGGYRTANKPIRWDYFDDGVEGEGDDEVRRILYDTYANLLAFRKQNENFFNTGAHFNWNVGESNWPKRTLQIKCPSSDDYMVLFGNFDTENARISVDLPKSGNWYNAFTGDVWTGSHHEPYMSGGKFYLLVSNPDDVLVKKWADPWPDPTPDPTPGPTPGGDTEEKQVRIYLSDAWGWPYLWCWDSNGTQIFAGANWPGTRYHGHENGYYYWNVPEAYVGKTVNMLAVREDQSEQSADFTNVVLDKSVYFKLDWTSEKGSHLVQENK